MLFYLSSVILLAGPWHAWAASRQDEDNVRSSCLIDINKTPPSSPDCSEYEAAEAMMRLHLQSALYENEHQSTSSTENAHDHSRNIHDDQNMLAGAGDEPESAESSGQDMMEHDGSNDLSQTLRHYGVIPMAARGDQLTRCKRKDTYTDTKSIYEQPGYWNDLMSNIPTQQEDIMAESHGSVSEENSLPSLSWSHNLRKSKIKLIYKVLTRSWPSDLDSSTRGRWEMLLSKWLDKHRDILQSIVKNDRDAWAHAIHWWTPQQITHRSLTFGRRKGSRERKKEMSTAAWLAGEIPAVEKEMIMKRLSAYWPGVTTAAIQSRLCTYTRLHGKIHSPEVLLYGDDDQFARAAELIFYNTDFKGYKNPDASPYDELHQPSTKYGVMDENGQPVYTPYEPTQRRSNGERYNTLQTWLKDLSQDEIDYFHNMVGRHYASNLKVQMRYRNYLLINEYLEEHPESLELLKQGDDYEAWKVAKETCVKPKYMQHPLVYPCLSIEAPPKF